MSSRTSSRGTHNSRNPKESAQKITPVLFAQGITGVQPSNCPVGELDGTAVVGELEGGGVVGSKVGPVVGMGAGVAGPGVDDTGAPVTGLGNGGAVAGHGPHSP